MLPQRLPGLHGMIDETETALAGDPLFEILLVTTPQTAIPFVASEIGVAPTTDIVAVADASKGFPRDTVRETGLRKRRYCPICEEVEVKLIWEERLPNVSCKSCGWVFSADWGELLETLGISRGGS